MSVYYRYARIRGRVVLCNIAEVLDLWLKTPVPFIFHEQGVLVEVAIQRSGLVTAERKWLGNLPGIESAHMMVTLHASVHDGGVTLFPNALFGDFMINPVGVTPHGLIDLAKLNGGAGVVLDRRLEGVIEITIVQEDVRVVEPAVEVSFNGLERLNNSVQFLVSGKDDEGGICARGVGFLDGETAGSEDFVIFFAYFPVKSARG